MTNGRLFGVTLCAIVALAQAVLWQHGRQSGIAWAEPLARVDAALAHGDVSGATTQWYSAYVAALYYRHRWDVPIAVGDARLRIERAAGSGDAGAAKARELYLIALFRARQAGSAQGVLRAAAAFEALVDRDVAAHALTIAAALQAAGHRVAGNRSVPDL